MPIAVAILLLDLTLVVHAAKTGRLCPWAYIILAIPGFGAVAYIVMEVVPEWMTSIEAQKSGSCSPGHSTVTSSFAH